MPQSQTAPARRPKRWFEYKKPIPWSWVLVLGVAVWLIFFLLWEMAVAVGWVTELLVPTPQKVLAALYDQFAHHGFIKDILISIYRILVSFAAACAIAIPLGILMGSFRVAESFFNPFVMAWRYLPAPSFIPILLMWFGTGDAPKLALLFIGDRLVRGGSHSNHPRGDHLWEAPSRRQSSPRNRYPGQVRRATSRLDLDLRP